jgi:hypothetical protein
MPIAENRHAHATIWYAIEDGTTKALKIKHTSGPARNAGHQHTKDGHLPSLHETETNHQKSVSAYCAEKKIRQTE